jgi:hypothetical protein
MAQKERAEQLNHRFDERIFALDHSTQTAMLENIS